MTRWVYPAGPVSPLPGMARLKAAAENSSLALFRLNGKDSPCDSCTDRIFFEGPLSACMSSGARGLSGRLSHNGLLLPCTPGSSGDGLRKLRTSAITGGLRSGPTLLQRA